MHAYTENFIILGKYEDGGLGMSPVHIKIIPIYQQYI